MSWPRSGVLIDIQISVVLTYIRYPGTNICFITITCHAGQVVTDFYLSDIIFGLPAISYNICYHGLNDLKTIFFWIVLHCLHISRYLCHFLYKICRPLRKSAWQFRQVQTNMYLPKCPFFSKIHLPGQAGKYLSQCLESFKNKFVFDYRFPDIWRGVIWIGLWSKVCLQIFSDALNKTVLQSQRNPCLSRVHQGQKVIFLKKKILGRKMRRRLRNKTWQLQLPVWSKQIKKKYELIIHDTHIGNNHTRFP